MSPESPGIPVPGIRRNTGTRCGGRLDPLPAFGTSWFTDSLQNVMALAAARLFIRKDLRTVASRQNCVGSERKHGCSDADHHHSKYVGEPGPGKRTGWVPSGETRRDAGAHEHNPQDSRPRHHRNCRSPEPVHDSRCSNRSGHSIYSGDIITFSARPLMSRLRSVHGGMRPDRG